MKSILTGLLFTVMLVSCSKQNEVPSTEIAPKQILLKNQNISVVNVSVAQTGGNQVTFKFTTEYEKDLKSIELLSGTSESLFCQMYIEYKGENMNQRTYYSITDNDPKGLTTYYMLKYTTKSGDWFCSPIYQVKLQK